MSQRSSLARPLALGLALVALGTLPALAKMLPGTFTAVKDAERVVLDYGDGSYDVRVLGVDAPEPGQPFADEARAFVRERVLGRDGAMRFKYRDDAGEMVARLLVDGQDVGLELVRAGLAWRIPSVRYKPTAEGRADALTAAELEARAAGRGIWSAPRPVAPWIFRGETEAAGAAPESFGEALAVAGGVDRNTSKKSGDDNECAIAKNPTNPQQLFVLCNTSTAGLFAARSTDGGATWTYPDPADETIADGDAGQGTSACCDPSLAWDSFGNLFVSYLGDSVDTLLSTDGGQTFTQLPTLDPGQFTDQQTLVTADLTGGAHVVWVVWNRGGAMRAAGASVTGLGAVGAWSPNAAGQAAPTTGSCSFGDIAVAPSGAVVQVCGPSGGQGAGSVRINVDADGLGAGGFGASIIATSTNVGGFDFIPAQNSRSIDPEAGLAFDRNSASPTFGRLYLLYTDEATNESNDTNILVRTSDDLGATWSAPLQVNDDGTTRSQFLPKIGTDAATGDVAVCWHDARNSATNTGAEIYCSTAAAGATPPLFAANTAVSDGVSTSNGAGVEFGDYMGMTVGDFAAHPVWADTSNSTGDNPNGSSKFDAYTDLVAMALFRDGFELGSFARWSANVVEP